MKNIYLIVVIIITFACTDNLFGQITANGNSGTSTTNYTNGSLNDPLYIWSATGIGNNTASLTATPPAGVGPFTFEWFYHDSPTSSWVSYSSDAGATSTINNLVSDGYRVEIYDSGSTLIGCYTAWVWNMNLEVSTSNTPTDCDATDISGTIDAESAFSYYNPPPPESIITAATEINICFSATHTWVSDLAFYLVGPPSCGSPIILLSPNPEVLNAANSICNSADDVSNLCFSTTSANTIDVCAEAGPLSGTFGAYGNAGSSTPIDWTALYGCNAASGGWSVQIYDCIGGDTGTLTNSDLTFSNLTSFCGSPTVINYTSGVISSSIDDNSCDAGSASIFEVPLPTDLTTPIDINADVTYLWTTDNGVVVPNPTTSLATSITGINDSTNFILTATIEYNGISGEDDDTTTFLNTCCEVLTSAGSDVMICSGESELLGEPEITGYTYSWSPSTGLDDPSIAQPTVTLTNSGASPDIVTYTLTATNITDGGCTQDFSVDVTTTPLSDAGFSLTNYCLGSTNAATIIGDAGGTFSFNPAVTDGASINGTTGEITDAVGGTTYSIDYSISGSCPETTNESVMVFSLPDVDAGSNETVCEGDNITLTGSISGTGALPITYDWDNGVTDGQSFTPPLGTITYTVIASDNNGCENSATVQIETMPIPQSIFSADPITGIEPLTVDFINSSIDANSFIWDFGNGDNNTVLDLSGQTTTYTNPGTYIASLTSSNGVCSQESTIEITVTPLNPIIIVPNVFTPNGDLMNDEWAIKTENVQSIEIFIVNRWGNTVFTISDLDGYWDGKVGSGEAASGVYFYKYTAIGMNGNETTGHGHLTLKRE